MSNTGSTLITARRRVGPGIAAGLLLMACDMVREIERPKPRFAVSPVEYPMEMWNQDVEGTTVVRVLVNEAGDVDSAVVAESSGYVLLDSAAIRGARVMEFEPALRGGEPLQVWARVPVHFAKDGGIPPEVPPEGESADTASESGPPPSGGDPSERQT